jgi:internalin A
LLSGAAQETQYLRRLSGRLPTVGYANDILLKEAGTPNCVLADAKLSKLAGISLSNRQIVDLQPLADLTSLNILYLDSNQISDLNPLAGLSKLTSLYLNNNQAM